MFISLHFLNKKENYKSSVLKVIKNPGFIFTTIILLVITAPFIYFIAVQQILSQFWSVFSISKILLVFTDYFSPIQANIVNTPDTFTTFLFKEDKINYPFIFFSIMPTIFALIIFIKSILSKNTIVNILFKISLCFFITLIFFSILGKMVLITKYTTEMYPALILILVNGFYEIKNNNLNKFLFIFYILINLIYICIAPDSAPKRTRPEGHLAPIELLKASRLKDNDFVLFTYYDENKFSRYLKNLPYYKIYSISKYDFNYYLYKNQNYKDVIKNGKTTYRNSFKIFPDPTINDYSKYTFQINMKKGDRIGIIFLNNVSFISNDNIQMIADNDKMYKNTPFIFLVFSTLRNNLLYSFKNDFKIDSITQAGDWSLFVFEKTN